jgi:nitrogen fixation/metabolism regulation signal transduction histidine kinase
MMGVLFEPYASNKTRGTGLGLAIVKKIIDEHQGTVRTKNQDPHGACIIIRLPLKRATP